ncbi:MAG: hypothetical protein IJI98_05090 [Methanosphaera sp.]|nr:hypothetical protein [Methanosphaera sp.]
MTNEKYLAPPWIKYPTYPEKSSFWKTGSGAEYLIKYNETINDKEEYLKIFPKAPSFKESAVPSESVSDEVKEYLQSPEKALIINLWQKDAKPKYDKITAEKKNVIFMFDTLFFDQSAHIHVGTKTYDSANEIVELLEKELQSKSPDLWEELKYTVIINALYYKLATDITFTKQVIRTDGQDIIFKSDNLELGVQEDDEGNYIGKNLLGFAVMEIRDVLKEVYANYDLIDWDISGDPYSIERCTCGHVHMK